MARQQKTDGGKILQLTVEGFKGIRAVEITPDGPVVRIEGKNGNGKTSILDSIGAVLCGKKWTKAAGISDPIHHGEKRAKIDCVIPGYTVTRIITAKSDRLEVVNESGAMVAKPQDVLDQLVGQIAFDPLEFSRMKPADQRDQLIEIFQPTAEPEAVCEAAGIARTEDGPITLDELDGFIEASYNRRRDIGRNLSEAKSELDALPDALGYKNLPTERIDSSEMVARYQERQRQANERERLENRLHNADNRIKQLEREIENTRAALADLCSQKEGHEDDRDGLAAKLEAMPQPEPERDMVAELERINEHNERYNKRLWIDDRRTSLEMIQANHDAETERLETLRRIRAEMVNSIELGVEGLEIVDGGLELNGVPLGQASQSERTIIGCRVAMAASPGLRVLRITDGSAIDSDMMAGLAKWAEADGVQIWIERVEDEPTGQGFYIVDGELQ